MANPQVKLDNSIVGVRSNQNMSFNFTGTADFGRIVPFHWEELIGTDKVVTCKPRIEIQMLPLASPTFGKMDLYVHYFLVPLRLLWRNSSDFFSQSGPYATSIPPYWTMKQFYDIYNTIATQTGVKRMLQKHWTSFGLPSFWTDSFYSSVSATSNRRISLLPFRAYNQVYWDFYRDPELIPDSNKQYYIDDTDGNEDPADINDVKYIARQRHFNDCWMAQCFASNGQISPTGLSIANSTLNPGMVIPSSGKASLYVDNNGNVTTVSQSTPSNTNSSLVQTDSQQLRLMEALTRMSERLSLSGKRQIDRLFAQYGIKPEFNKLQMAQYVGGAKASVLVSDITSSADTTQGVSASGYDNGAPLGMKAGAGYCAFNNLNIKVTAHEPSILLGVFSIMPQIHFNQGMSKRFFRNSINDFFRKELEHVGLVAVRKDEVRCSSQGSPLGSYHPADAETFAFTQPYYDYKMHPDVIAGDFDYYKNSSYNPEEYGDRDIAYMLSMNLYQDYAIERTFNANNLMIDARKSNKVFYYLGGSVWEDVDDHFHINADVKCIINRPMDGFAVPTVETTEDPHVKKSDVGHDVVL